MALCVFLVEDNPTISENLIATLEELVGAEIMSIAADEPAACQWLCLHDDWSLAIVDLFLKTGSGLGVLRVLQQRRATQRVVLLTNYATADVRIQCKLLGVDRVFDKSTE